MKCILADEILQFICSVTEELQKNVFSPQKILSKTDQGENLTLNHKILSFNPEKKSF